MTPVERIEYMLKMEATRPEKDGAGIFIPSGMDAAIKRKTLEEVLKVVCPNRAKKPQITGE